jgi:hypothetical protein
MPNLLEADVVMLGGLPFLRLEITCYVVSGGRSAGNGHEDVLQVWKRQAFERPEHPVLVNGLERHSHVFKFSGLPSGQSCVGTRAGYDIPHEGLLPGNE